MLISATEFKNNFGQYIDFSKKDPVFVEENGRKVGVFLSVDEYDRLCELDDAYWGAKALDAKANSPSLGENSLQVLLDMAQQKGIKIDLNR